MTIEQHLLVEMKLCNIIKDDGDAMIWKGPDNMYKFEIQRYDNIISYSPNGSRFIIEITVRDGITNTVITVLKMSEIDVIKMLDEMDMFVFEMFDTYSSSVIRFNTFDTSMELYQILLTRIDEDPHLSDKTILMDIGKYNPMNEMFIPMIRMKLNETDLTDFMFCIYFHTLIDIDIPGQYYNRMEEVITNFIEVGCLNDRGY